MESKIAQALGLTHHPVVVIFAEEKPEGALQFKPGTWSCVMFMFANACRGKTAAFDAETYGCWGGGVGLGFGNAYEAFPGGVDCFTHFLSSGNNAWETGKKVGEGIAAAGGKEFADNFLLGERYVQTPELVRQWIEELPITQIAARYVLFKPLQELAANEQPQTLVFLADADQISALTILANYGREGMDNVIMPWAAGCQTIGILPYREAKSERPRAVVGLTDISARKYVRSLLGAQFLTFAVPWSMFGEMEENVPGSFLERHVWQSLRGTSSSAD